MSATTTSASSNCSSFFNFRCGGPTEKSRQRATRGGGGGGGRLIDGVGMWVVNGFAAAFFASLERLSCIRITTHEDDGDDGNDVVPLMHYSETVSRRRNKGKAFKKDSGSSFLED